MAPGLKGANRTGRPFTGDHAGLLLYGSLLKFGLAEGAYDARPDDGLRLTRCRIVNAVRCVPPKNLPEPAEIRTCNTFLAGEIAAMPNLRAILVLASSPITLCYAPSAWSPAEHPSNTAPCSLCPAAKPSPTAIMCPATTRTPASSPKPCSTR